MKKPEVRVKLQLSERLMKPLPAKSSEADINEALRELFAWAGVAAPDDIRRDVAGGSPWAALAVTLAIETLPCFAAIRRQSRKKGGAPKKADNPELRALEAEQYQNAGGSLLSSWHGEALEKHQQALFVLCVRDIQAGRARSHAFRALAKEKNRSRLPLRYRGLRTVLSIESAYKAIPDIIRQEPKRFVPKLEVPMGWSAWWSAEQAKRVQRVQKLRLARRAKARQA